MVRDCGLENSGSRQEQLSDSVYFCTKLTVFLKHGEFIDWLGNS
jgi:hypothetical protein